VPLNSIGVLPTTAAYFEKIGAAVLILSIGFFLFRLTPEKRSVVLTQQATLIPISYHTSPVAGYFHNQFVHGIVF
jgi:hypothetical protein